MWLDVGVGVAKRSGDIRNIGLLGFGLNRCRGGLATDDESVR